ncbi:archaea-specific SMC-related protein [Haloplanus salilacus]|uniref:archaea-specific SMC-related protein n=1 Tax=Haloplanus salilacus TaxID=2949994 RepID=UPI0030CC69D0
MTDDDSATPERMRLDVLNVGGIEHASVSFEPGVTMVVGENASNKSSLLGGLGGVLGGSPPSLRGGADSGSVTLDVDGERFALDLSDAAGETVVVEATPYTTASTLVDLFVDLSEGNPIRRAVVGGGDFHDLLMRPVDTEEIDAEIRRLTDTRNDLDDRIDDLDDRVGGLPELEVRRRRLIEEREEVTATLSERRAALSELDYRDAAAATRDLLDDLKDARAERERLRDRRETKRRALESLREDLASVEERLAALDDAESSVEERLAAVEERLSTLREREGRLDETIAALGPIVELNQGFLAEGERAVDDDVVEALGPDEGNVTCWTCGQSAARAEIESQVAAVEAILDEKREERATVEAEIEACRRDRSNLEDRREERVELVERRRRLGEDIDERERALSDLDDRIDDAAERIRDLEAELDGVEGAEELVERHEAVSDLEYERGRLDRKLAEVEADIEAAESARAEREDLRAERDDVAEQLATLRGRVERIERETVETVNDCMERILNRLVFDAVERVWIERRETDDGTVFDPHVVRTGDDGTVYRASVDTLSKSEREVVGLVMALAGYLVYDVADAVPVVVVDAVEMLDADRVRGLLDFFDDHARYVVAAVLPEEAAPLREWFDAVSTEAFDPVRS